MKRWGTFRRRPGGGCRTGSNICPAGALPPAKFLPCPLGPAAKSARLLLPPCIGPGRVGPPTPRPSSAAVLARLSPPSA
eukprot:8212675-Ditylum_brightwellii.AAC.1